MICAHRVVRFVITSWLASNVFTLLVVSYALCSHLLAFVQAPHGAKDRLYLARRGALERAVADYLVWDICAAGQDRMDRRSQAIGVLSRVYQESVVLKSRIKQGLPDHLVLPLETLTTRTTRATVHGTEMRPLVRMHILMTVQQVLSLKGGSIAAWERA